MVCVVWGQLWACWNHLSEQLPSYSFFKEKQLRVGKNASGEKFRRLLTISCTAFHSKRRSNPVPGDHVICWYLGCELRALTSAYPLLGCRVMHYPLHGEPPLLTEGTSFSCLHWHSPLCFPTGEKEQGKGGAGHVATQEGELTGWDSGRSSPELWR